MAAIAGVDVSKDSVDVSVSEGPMLRFDNLVKGITKLLKHLKKQEAPLTVCESTGGYERLLVNRLHKAVGLPDGGVQVDGKRSVPGPAPALAKSSRLTRSNCLTWSQRKLRRKVPRVDGALTTQPRTLDVPPLRIGVVDAVAADQSGGTRVISFSPVLARPRALPKSRCRSTNSPGPRRRARIAGSNSPALATKR